MTKYKNLGIVAIIISVGVLYYFLNPSEHGFFPRCLFYKYTGFHCPGCGSQRATHHLMNFDLLGVLRQNVLYIIGLLIILYHLIIISINYFFKKDYYNYLNHPKTPIVVLITVFLFWILRNLPWYPFTLLAPQ